MSGKKTYTAVIAYLLYAVSGWASGSLDTPGAVSAIAQALMVAGLRHGIANGGN